MQIRRKLQINTLLAVGITLLAGMFIFAGYLQSMRVSERLNQTSEIIRNIFELNILTNEYLVNPSERVVVQWNNKSRQFSAYLRSVANFGVEDNKYLQEITRLNRNMREVFDRLVKMAKSDGGREPDGSLRQLRRRLATGC